ncbi:hypothetical protein HYC85_009982, partial [Camellia sinensis]
FIDVNHSDKFGIYGVCQAILPSPLIATIPFVPIPPTSISPVEIVVAAITTTTDYMLVNRLKFESGLSQLGSSLVHEVEYRCFVGGLSWSTSDRDLKDAFEKFGHLLEAKVAVDKFSGRSRGFGFVTFDEKKTMEEAIEAMHGMDLDGRTITVEKAQPHQGSGRDHDSDRSRDRDRDRGRDRDRSRDYGGGRGSGGGDCFKCGKPGSFC